MSYSNATSPVTNHRSPIPGRRSLIACLFIIASVIILSSCKHDEEENKDDWPAITRETKPWTRWWWHGSALTKEGITAEMEAYQKAGIGGLEITPIYGVSGYEDKFITYLSPEWMELLAHVLNEGQRLDMGIDMATGTGWPFGGPWVTEDDACKTIRYKVFTIEGSSTLSVKIEFIQEPFLRAVGNQIYEVHENAGKEGRIVQGTRKEPLIKQDRRSITIKELTDPVAANKNLQALALDQVQFEKPLPLKILMAYSDTGETTDLTSRVDSGGRLNWKAPPGHWTLYALFEGWHGKMVERAGPGGEGNVIDHFSKTALKNYLQRFDSAFARHDIRQLRAFFNDSYEVDDARGSADFTPSLFHEFEKRRGYDLLHHLPALFGRDENEKNQRILCDYRETISELLLENFTLLWKDWAHQKSAIVRNQAHGSPANILDLYALVDIPEIEGTEPLRLKMASSSANVTGKKLVSAEAATWLNEHFESNLSDIKIALDRFMLNGINHLVYHGTAYSPPGEPWPGWLFYAAVHLNSRNPQWDHFRALNEYVARCQAFLQNSKPDNDVLLYYPIYDPFSTPGNEMIEHFDGIGKQFEGTSFAKSAEVMQEKGYSFDYISDKQIQKITVENGLLKTEGNSVYKLIVLPHCQFIPLKTMEKIISLAKEGAMVIMVEGPPLSVSGYGNLGENKKRFEDIMQVVKGGSKPFGEGRLMIGDSLYSLLTQARIERETMVDSGIRFIRKKNNDGGSLYFVSNIMDELFEGWLPLQVSAGSVILYDPMNKQVGKARIRKTSAGITEVFIRLERNESLVLESFTSKKKINSFPYFNISDNAIEISGKWKITFDSGGPELPQPIETETLSSWTTFEGEEYQAFSGSAIYRLEFTRPGEKTSHWLLDLGMVKESAEVFLNKKSIGTLIGPVFKINFDSSLLRDNNVLEIRVSNLMANRIAAMDRNKVFWKKFYNVNFPARKEENRINGLFNASHWRPKDSGLMGPVQLIPLTLQ